jgi:hypothetical protein
MDFHAAAARAHSRSAKFTGISEMVVVRLDVLHVSHVVVPGAADAVDDVLARSLRLRAGSALGTAGAAVKQRPIMCSGRPP